MYCNRFIWLYKGNILDDLNKGLVKTNDTILGGMSINVSQLF
jgi:hypothetical protein